MGERRIHQLIVLGNGFDLSCGLRSDFASYLSYRWDEIENGFVDSNVWDVYLAALVAGSADWTDIESAIAMMVSEGPNGPAIVDSLVDSQKEQEDVVTDCGLDRQELQETLSAIRSLCKVEMISSDVAVGCLLEELHRYERAFSKYLAFDVCGATGYEPLAKQTFAWLRDDGVPSQDECLLFTTVLSFNYTEPLGVNDADYGVIHYRNIHGSLSDENIIFGIDGFSHPGLRELPFTKTYRLLSQQSEVNGVVYPDDTWGYGKTEVIKFYGHSLAEADYSYFQALFDAVDLYGSDVRLVFYYSIYNDGKDEATRRARIKEGMCNRVSRLLMRYGQTFDNEGHGKNLMHKLLLEGRLSVVEANRLESSFESSWKRPI